MKTNVLHRISNTVGGGFLHSLLLALPLVFSGAHAATPGSLVFDAPITYGSGGPSSWQMSVEDFNGDSIPDFTVVNAGVYPSGTGNLAVFLGNGDGTFEGILGGAAGDPPIIYPMGVIPQGLVTGDLNKDGAPDAVVVNRQPFLGSGFLSILLNNNDGTGTFSYAPTVPSGSQPMHAAIGDLDGDTNPDIAVAVHGSDAVQILLGDGNGNFAQFGPLIPAGNGVNGIQIADMDNDNFLDVVTSNWWSYNVTILKGAGDGTFTQPYPRPAIGQRSWTVEVGDLNNDGFLDIVAPNALDLTISILMGNGSGTFAPQVLISAGPNQPYELELVDINMDGCLDMVVPNSDVRIFYGKGDGTFHPRQDLGINMYPSAGVTDFNGDGALDIVANKSNQGDPMTVSVFLQIPPNQDPIADAGEDQDVECTGELTTITLDGSNSSDPDGHVLDYEWSVAAGSGATIDDPDSAVTTGSFPPGPTMATLTVTDGNGGMATDDVVITVVDTIAPAFVCTTDVAVLWPPNHKMRDVTICVEVTELCSDVEDLVLTSEITSSEADNGKGDGNTTWDVNGEDGYAAPVPVELEFDPLLGCFTGSVQLRAERAGGGDGRVYSIVTEVTDLFGNSSAASCVVLVPHDMKNKKK